MSSRRLWLIAIGVTLVSVIYQRRTGPTYPVRVHQEVMGVTITAKLPRSHVVTSDLPIGLQISGGEATGEVVWHRLGTNEPWQHRPLVAVGSELTATLPRQPAAGKLEYWVELQVGGQVVRLDRGGKAIVARFKGAVPVWILAPHILLMFLGMLWSTRTGLEALVNGPRRRVMALTTLGLLLAGGMILGPLVQKHAFGAYWTGWPFGEDLTDNKLAVAVLAWVWAVLRSGEGRGTRIVTIVASVVVFGVYLIPHSFHGSTLDYASGKMISG